MQPTEQPVYKVLKYYITVEWKVIYTQLSFERQYMYTN